MRETLGIKHVALKVRNFNECLDFYTNIVGMSIDWKPDEENAYLGDNQSLDESTLAGKDSITIAPSIDSPNKSSNTCL